MPPSSTYFNDLWLDLRRARWKKLRGYWKPGETRQRPVQFTPGLLWDDNEALVRAAQKFRSEMIQCFDDLFEYCIVCRRPGFEESADLTQCISCECYVHLPFAFLTVGQRCSCVQEPDMEEDSEPISPTVRTLCKK